MNYSDPASAGTNIRLETKYLHGLNDGDSIEVGALQRSDDLNYHPVRVQVLGPVIELLNTERLQLPNFNNLPTGTINLLERDVDSTALTPYTLESQDAIILNILHVNETKPIVVEVQGKHAFLQIGTTVSFNDLMPPFDTLRYAIDNVSFTGDNTKITLADSADAKETTESIMPSPPTQPTVVKEGAVGTISRGDVMSLAATVVDDGIHINRNRRAYQPKSLSHSRPKRHLSNHWKFTRHPGLEWRRS